MNSHLKMARTDNAADGNSRANGAFAARCTAPLTMITPTAKIRPRSPDPIPALRAEVATTQAKLDRLRAALASRQQKLNRLLAEDAMNGTAATARRHEH
jgi:hypothetical protein